MDNETNVLEFLEHAGVKGMKWGVRQSKSKTGVSRSRGALIDRNDRLSSNIDKARAGEKYKLLTKGVGKIIGREQQLRNWDTMQGSLKAQNERLTAGKLLVGDRLSLIGGVSVAELVVSVRPEDR